MDMAKLLGGLGTVKAIDNCCAQMDLTELARIVSTLGITPFITDWLLTLLFYPEFRRWRVFGRQVGDFVEATTDLERGKQ
jgi:hypothetical protein